MSSDSSNSGTSGVGVSGLLTVLFVALKLIPHGAGHIINWSWWWVLSPLWISGGVVLLIVGAVIVVALVADR